jgi:hypothetical protein
LTKRRRRFKQIESLETRRAQFASHLRALAGKKPQGEERSSLRSVPITPIERSTWSGSCASINRNAGNHRDVYRLPFSKKRGMSERRTRVAAR